MKDIKQEILAKAWAEDVLRKAGDGAIYKERVIAAATVLNETMEVQTLAGVTFEPLVGAVTGAGNEVIAISERAQGGIDCYYPNRGKVFMISAMDLYPNGKRYKIVEDTETVSQHGNVGDDQPEPPKALCSEQDYQGAPIGTIVAANGENVYLKTGDHSWCIAGVEGLDEGPIHDYMRTVLRWGWGS